MQWKHLFSLPMLMRGQQYYYQGRVKSHQKIDETHYLSIKGTKMYHVWIQIRNGEFRGMSCTCPHAREGSH